MNFIPSEDVKVQMLHYYQDVLQIVSELKTFSLVVRPRPWLEAIITNRSSAKLLQWQQRYLVPLFCQRTL